MDHWYLLRCKSRQEKRAESHLVNQGYRCYGPNVSVNKSRTIIPKLVSEPLFPGYLFISMDCAKGNWSAVRSTRGVLDFVRFGDCAAKVPVGLVELLKEKVPELEANLSSSIQLSKGDQVQILDGCFKGLNAVFSCDKGKDRVLVLINIVGASTEVQLEKSFLEKF